jgi:hypothetical protein
MTKLLDTSSPCIGVCSTVAGDDICKGCLRTFEEMVSWHTYDDATKDRINKRIRTAKRELALKHNKSTG